MSEQDAYVALTEEDLVARVRTQERLYQAARLIREARQYAEAVPLALVHEVERLADGVWAETTLCQRCRHYAHLHGLSLAADGQPLDPCDCCATSR